MKCGLSLFCMFNFGNVLFVTITCLRGPVNQSLMMGLNINPVGRALMLFGVESMLLWCLYCGQACFVWATFHRAGLIIPAFGLKVLHRRQWGGSWQDVVRYISIHKLVLRLVVLKGNVLLLMYYCEMLLSVGVRREGASRGGNLFRFLYSQPPEDEVPASVVKRGPFLV